MFNPFRKQAVVPIYKEETLADLYRKQAEAIRKEVVDKIIIFLEEEIKKTSLNGKFSYSVRGINISLNSTKEINDLEKHFNDQGFKINIYKNEADTINVCIEW